MIKKIQLYVTKMLIIASSLTAIAQEKIDYPIIGKEIPEFSLQNIEYFNKTKIESKELRGKYLIIDFFSRGCTACFTSFPHVNELKRKYGNQVEFIIVGLISNKKSYAALKTAYDRYRDRYKLTLPVSYDSALGKRFKISGVPHILWIDKNGIVKAITNEIKDENIVKFIDNRDFKFTDYSYNGAAAKKNVDYKASVITSEIGADSTVIQKSILSIWKEGMPTTLFHTDITAYIKASMPLQLPGRPLSDLYRMAYFGKVVDWLASDSTFYGYYRYSPILEILDSSKFNEVNRYSYALKVRPERQHQIQAIMQRDLKNFFGYNAHVEERDMPILILVASEKAKKTLLTRGGKPIKNHSFGELELKNIPISMLIDIISYDSYLVSKDLPLFNETGITGNIDLKFSAVMTDWRDIKRALNEQGLDLKIGSKKMKCIIIQNPLPDYP